MKTFKEWIESVGHNCLYLYQNDNGVWIAKIDAPGWYSGQWMAVPPGIEITEEIEKAYRGI